MSSGASVAPDASLRLFLALDLPAEARLALARWAEEHVGVGRRLAPDDLHVTLAFLGRRLGREVEPIVDALRAACEGVRIGPLEVQRWRETPRVGMLVLADPSGAATELRERLRVRLVALGAEPAGPEPWLAHVTLVRLRERPRLRPPLPEGRTFVPSDAAAYLSHLGRSGARYEALARVPLEPMTGG